MLRSGATRSFSFLVVGFAAVVATGSANAGSTATRCDARGCVHVHCNATGDRCYRYSDAGGAWPESRYSTLVARPHSRAVCDPDGDRCYPSQGHRWNFREYYRRLGYRWSDEAH
jgi:hypothetical protein